MSVAVFYLLHDGINTHECTRYCTTVYIVNYEKYQGFFEFDGSGNAQRNAQRNAQQNAQQNAHNIRKKELKESKELNNKDYMPGAETPPAPPKPPT